VHAGCKKYAVMGDIESSRPALPDENQFAYRVSLIPEDLSIEETTRLLEQSLAVTDLKVESLAMDSNGCQGQVATITSDYSVQKASRQIR
jgi:rRNA maturation endonuclease Nob1